MRKLAIFNHVLEFRLRKKENKEKLKLLLDLFLKELKAQGHNVKGISGCDYVSIFKHSDCYHISTGASESIEIEFEEELTK